MKSTNKMDKQEHEQINSFLASLQIEAKGKLKHEQLREAVEKQFGVKLSYDSIRKRMARMKKNDTFEVELEKNNFTGDWSHGWLKTDTASIFIRNDKGVMSYEEIRDELVSEMKKYAPKYPKIKRVKLGGHLLVVDPADVHFGKLAVKEETGNDYNLAIAEMRFATGIDSLISKAQAFGIDSVVLVVGNDILHVDNPKRTTTAGTPQDTDGMWWEAYNTAKRCYIQAIEKLLTLGDVKLVFCPSNHDFMSGYMLTDAVVSWFSKHPNVSAHASMAHRKYVKFGNNLLGFTHGDGAKVQDLPNLMMTETRGLAFEYGAWLIHHGHHKDKSVKRSGSKQMEKVEEDKLLITEIHTAKNIDPKNSISVEMVRTPSGADRWHDTNGYKNIQAIEVFLFHPVGGQVARLTNYF